MPSGARPQAVARAVRRARSPWLLGGALLLLVVAVRTRAFRAGFWIDDGIAVGIASHPLADIPAVLRQDGSPPLYYVLLHGWLALFGSSEAAAYSLSLVFALLAIPVAAWAGRSLFGRRAGWTCAVLAAANPVAGTYSGQARMYTLLVLLGLVAAASFAHAFLHGRRAALWPFGIALTLMLYTHGWAIFFGVGCAAAVAPCWWVAPTPAVRRRVLRDAALAFGLTGLAFAPWLPTLLDQARHTGAPWSIAPARAELFRMSTFVLGVALVSPLTLGVALGLARRRAAGERAEVAAALAVGTIAVVTLAVGWKAGRLTHAWAPRYAAVGVGPAVLLAGAGLARAGRIGVVCLVFTIPTWLPREPATISAKSNVAQALGRTELHGRRGDLVVATQPELGPVLRYYLGGAPRYATTLGPTADPGVMDWRDALDRLRATRADTFSGLLDAVPVGGRVVVVTPKGPPQQVAWQRLIHLRTRQWLRVLGADPRFRLRYATARGYRLGRWNIVTVLVAERRRA